MKKHEAIRNAKNFDELLDIQYGKMLERKLIWLKSNLQIK
jgi:hypothetical protein